MALCDRLEAQQQERDTRHAALARASLARFADAPTPANLNFLFHPSYAISPADLRKTILSLAVQGKLVHKDQKDETGLELFRRIDSTREALLSRRSIKLSSKNENPSDMDTDFNIPPEWFLDQIRNSNLMFATAHMTRPNIPMMAIL